MKYDIDPTLTGKAREKAKKNAVKKIKKEAAKRQNKKSEDGHDGIKRAGRTSTFV